MSMKKILLMMFIALPGLVSAQAIKYYSVDNKGTAILAKETRYGKSAYYLAFKDYSVSLGDSASCIKLLEGVLNDKYKNRTPHVIDNGQNDSAMYWYDYGVMSYYFFNGKKKSPCLNQNEIKAVISAVKNDTFEDFTANSILSTLSSSFAEKGEVPPSYYLERTGSLFMLSFLLDGFSVTSYMLGELASVDLIEMNEYFFYAFSLITGVGALVTTILGYSNIRKAGIALGKISLNVDGVKVRF